MGTNRVSLDANRTPRRCVGPTVAVALVLTSLATSIPTVSAVTAAYDVHLGLPFERATATELAHADRMTGDMDGTIASAVSGLEEEATLSSIHPLGADTQSVDYTIVLRVNSFTAESAEVPGGALSGSAYAGAALSLEATHSACPECQDREWLDIGSDDWADIEGPFPTDDLTFHLAMYRGDAGIPSGAVTFEATLLVYAHGTTLCLCVGTPGVAVASANVTIVSADARVTYDPSPTIRPDLTITGVAHDPATPREGEPFNVTVKVKNAGNAASPSSYVSFTSGGDVGGSEVPPLAPGASQDVRFEATLWGKGTHDVQVMVDPAGSLFELDETNNAATHAVEVLIRTNVPDLVVSDLRIAPDLFSDGSSVRFEAIVTNIGPATAFNFPTVSFYLDGQFDQWNEYEDSLASGQSVNIVSYYPWVAREGTHTLTAIADEWNNEEEWDEDNNVRALEFFVPGNPNPDAIGPPFEDTYTNYVQSCTPFSGSGTIIFSDDFGCDASGTVDAQSGHMDNRLFTSVAGGFANSVIAFQDRRELDPPATKLEFTVRWRLNVNSFDANMGLDENPLLGTYSTEVRGVFSVGDCATCKHRFTVQHQESDAPANDVMMAAGEYVSTLVWTSPTPTSVVPIDLRFITDMQNRAQGGTLESLLDVDFIEVRSAVPRPYAVAVLPELQSIEVAPGGSGDAIIAVTNEGTNADTVSLAISGGGAGWSGSVSPAGLDLPPGGQGTATVHVQAPTKGAPVSFVITATSAGDPSMTDTARVQASVVPTPDLVLTQLSFSPANPIAGDTVTFAATVENQGDLATPTESVLRFLLDGIALADLDVASLAPGMKSTLTQSWVSTAGGHTVRAVADAGGAIAESLETNNERSASVSVAPITRAVDLTPPTQSKNVPAKGTATFDVTVTNTGNRPDTVLLSLNGSKQGWSSSLSTSSVGLAPGESTVVQLTVKAGAAGSLTVKVVGTSQSDPSAKDSSSCTTRVTK
ncbi:MAG: hypothetical protein HYT80_05195 [Euryarchaeota archaeon]|nr:hypothetical protein [Euryarchaeota archaeon]